MVSVSVPDSLFFFLQNEGEVDTSISSAVMILILERQPFNYIIL